MGLWSIMMMDRERQGHNFDDVSLEPGLNLDLGLPAFISYLDFRKSTIQKY